MNLDRRINADLSTFRLKGTLVPSLNSEPCDDPSAPPLTPFITVRYQRENLTVKVYSDQSEMNKVAHLLPPPISL